MRHVAFFLAVGLSATVLVASPSQRGVAQPQTPQTPQMPQGGPIRQQQEPLTYEGLIIGRVIDASTSRPVAGAAVTINGGTQPPMAPVSPGAPRPMPTQPPKYLTDADGRFAFRNLTRGNYNLSVEKSGYAPGTHGQSRPEGPSRSLQLADRERRGDVTIRLFKYATISGTIVDDIGEPVVAARVRVLRRALVAGRRMLQQGQTTQTDDRGQYRVAGLMPGEYVVSVPQSSSSLPSDFTMSGPMPANLSSTISTPGSTGFSFASTGPLTADGRFRLSNAGTSPFITVPGASGRVMAYGTQYYPSAAVVSQAQPIVVASGEDRSGVDLVLRLQPTASVAGMLMGPDGPAVNFGLHLVPSDTGEMSVDPSIATAVTDMNGAFAFLAVPSGQYVIQTVRVPRPTPPASPVPLQTVTQSFTSSGPGGAPITGTMTMATMGVSGSVAGGVPGGVVGGLSYSGPPAPAVSTEPTLWVAMPISVGDIDIGGLALNLREGLSVSGQVEFDGAAERPIAARLTQMSASLQPADGKQRSGSQQGRLDANGRFTIPQVVPGLYRLNVSGGIGGWNVRSAMLNGVDVLDVPLTLDSRNITNIVVTFTDRTSTLAGTVRMPISAADSAAGQKNPDVAVIIFPSDPQLINLGAGFNARRTRMVRSGQVGASFGFGSLPPGDYYVIAIPDEYSSEWQDPKFLEYLARSATPVTIGEGERKTIDLAIENVRPPGREPAPAATAARASASHAETSIGDDRERGPFVDEREPLVDEREQAPPQARDARIEARVGSGSISGVVLLDDTTPRPVRHARVSISGGVGASRTVLTDGDGRFRVDLLPAARYSINATKPAYLTAYHGNTRPGRGPGTPVILAAGESRTDITLRMARGAVITGTISDEFGAPLQGLTVRVMQPMMRDGERTWATVGIPSGGPTASDDRGVYRVYGLPPGNYALSVMPPNTGNMAETRQLSEGEMRAAIAALTAPVAVPQETLGSGLANLPTGLPGRGGLPGRAGLATGRGTGPTSSSSAAPPPRTPPAQPPQPAPSFPPVGRAVGYSPVFYPGTALEHEATLISVGIGQELTGIDLPMRLIPTAKIEGSVVTPDGRPAERVNVQVVSTLGNSSSSTGVRMAQDGKFMTGSLPPGKYMLTVRVMAPPPPPPPPGPGNPAGAVPGPVPMSSMNPALWAQEEVVVNGEDITGLTLTLAEGTTITGRVVFQGTLPQPDPTRVRITAEPVGANRVLMGIRSASMDASGAFELTGVTPGRYRLSATSSLPQPLATATAPAPPIWALRSSLVAGRDTLDMPIEIGPGQDVRGAVLTFTDKPAELSGAILDAARNGIPDLTVALFATDRALWTMNPRRLRSLRSVADGSFRFLQMPPGEYFLAVISELDQSSWGDPAFMEQVAAAAIRLTIGEGEKKVQDIQIR